MTSGHVCVKCGTAMQFDFDGSPRCGKCNGLWARSRGAVVLIVGTALLVAIWMVGTPDDSCEHNTSVVLKGTFGDCEARNPPPSPPSDQAERALASR